MIRVIPSYRLPVSGGVLLYRVEWDGQIVASGITRTCVDQTLRLLPDEETVWVDEGKGPKWPEEEGTDDKG